MRRLLSLTVVLSLCSWVLSCPVMASKDSTTSVVHDKVYEAWNTMEIQDGDGVRYRAWTVEADDAQSILTVDAYPGACDEYYFNINLIVGDGDQNFDTYAESELMKAQIRVDKNQIRSFNFKLVTEPGDSVVFLTPQNDVGGVDLINELMSGDNVRVKIDEHVLRFTLDGAHEALAQITNSCQKSREESSKSSKKENKSSKSDDELDFENTDTSKFF